MGDSYRKSAALLVVNAEPLAKVPLPAERSIPAVPAVPAAAGIKAGAPLPPNPLQVAAAKRERLVKAYEWFDKAIDFYRRMPPAGETDKLYCKLSHFYRA